MSASVERLEQSAFDELRGFLTNELGIQLPPAKNVLLQTRLQTRLRALELPTMAAYRDLVLGERRPSELAALLDAVTTNTTEFFREAHHFEHLVQHAIPSLRTHDLLVWSAGCSTGEEPYTLAMSLAEHARVTPGFRFRVLGTDVSTRVLAHARQATYDVDRLAGVPQSLRDRYFRKSRDPAKRIARVAPLLRATVSLQPLNFMDADYGLSEAMHVVFFRNVGIYFSREVRAGVVSRLLASLQPGGFLYVGTSESLVGLDVPVERVAASVYRKRAS